MPGAIPFDTEAQLKRAVKLEHISSVVAFATKQDGTPILYSQGKTAMHIAVQEKKLEVVRSLPACLINLAMSTTKETPLHIAARKGLHQIVALLLERGARRDLRSIVDSNGLPCEPNASSSHPAETSLAAHQPAPTQNTIVESDTNQREISNENTLIGPNSSIPQQASTISAISTPITPIAITATPKPNPTAATSTAAATTSNQNTEGNFPTPSTVFMPPQFQMFQTANTLAFPNNLPLPFPPPFFPGMNPFFPTGGISEFKPALPFVPNNMNSTPQFPTTNPPVGNFTFKPPAATPTPTLAAATTSTTTTTSNNNTSKTPSPKNPPPKNNSSGAWVSALVKGFSGVLNAEKGGTEPIKYTVSVYESASSTFKNSIRHLLRMPTVAFDSEGFSPSGPSLLQFAALGDNQSNPVRARDHVYVYTFDLLSPSANEMMHYLKPILELHTIVKVTHDLSIDSHQLFLGHEIRLRGVFDTQIAYEYLTGHMLSGLGTVVEKFSGKSHSTKNAVRNLMVNDAKNLIWTKRPIKQQLLDYAANDVVLLLASVPALKSAVEEKCAGAYDTILRVSQNRADRCAVTDPDLAKKRPIGFVGEPPKICSRKLLVDNIDQSGASKPRQLSVDQAMENILELIPEQFRTKLGDGMQIYSLRDIILDVDRPPYAYFSGAGGKSERVYLNDNPGEIYTRDMLNRAMELLEGRFGPDNRAGMDGSLHRISGMRNNRGEVYALTIRIGRSVPGNSYMIRDLLLDPSRSVLLLGVPGSGKTTIVRDAARLIAEEQLNVVVVDTSNEICGDGDVPHWSVGMARRMMVPNVESQARVMIECVQNHTPDVIVIDEIGRPNEVAAAKTVKQRGVRLVASAHGSFRQLVRNPQLNGLVGGVSTVLVGDKAAKEMHDGHKQVAERCGEPIFDTVVELRQNAFHIWRVIDQSGAAVDDILSGRPFRAHYRQRQPEGDHVTIRLAKIGIEDDEMPWTPLPDRTI